MDFFTSPDWSGIFMFSVPPLEIVARGSLMYWCIFVLLRVAGRRDIGSLGVADMLVLVLIADAAQNGMAGEYTSVADGVILVGVIVGWTVLIDRVVYSIPALSKALSLNHICLVRDGALIRSNLRREAITEEELMGELRQQGIDRLALVRRAYIEADGNISVLRAERTAGKR
ncbi:YetF domain-containing protein [Castellaniella ginsengisoli]|uniref:YetF domain-containing protein n=1 Tax=Castellaniella ginsengisoli TaxID=546114 RepID=A0AB39FKC3_9BURK